MSRVVIHFDADGEMSVLFEPGASVIWVDDRMPHDRLYRQESSTCSAEIDALIGEGPVGHSGDARQDRLKVQIHHMQHGLKDVEIDG